MVFTFICGYVFDIKLIEITDNVIIMPLTKYPFLPKIKKIKYQLVIPRLTGQTLDLHNVKAT